MLRLEALAPQVRELVQGNRCTVKRITLMGGPPAGTLLSMQASNQCLLHSPLCFTAPVGITSVRICAQSCGIQPVVVLAYDSNARVVQLARDLAGQPYGKVLTFLSPMGLESRSEFTLYVCQHNLGSDQSFALERLEIAYFAAHSEPIADGALDADDAVTFEVEGQSLQANKFILAGRSSVFKAQLFGQCAEAAAGVVHVSDFSFVGFSFFLSLLGNSGPEHAYHMVDCAPPEVDMVEVCALADKYCTVAVRNMAEAGVLQRVDETNARELLEQCRRHRATGLAQRICEQVVARFSKESVADLLKEFVARLHA